MKMTVRDGVSAYEAHVISLGWSQLYRKQAFTYLRKFIQACSDVSELQGRRDGGGPLVQNIDHECIDRYFTGLAGQSQAAWNNGTTAIRGFLAFLEDRGEIPGGMSTKLLKGRKTKPKVRKPKHYIKVNEFQDFLDASGKRHAADRAAMAIALYTLARQGEITSLRLKDIDWDRMIIRITRHKRHRWTDVPVGKDLGDELARWLVSYADEIGYGAGVGVVRMMMQDHPDWYLIPRLEPVRNKGPWKASETRYVLQPELPTRRLEQVVKDALDALSASGTVHSESTRHVGEGMHTIRRSGARAMLDHLASLPQLGQDKALLQVSIMLDHEDTKITLDYIGRDIERDRLHDYLRSGSMYGDGHKVKPQSNVVQLRREGVS